MFKELTVLVPFFNDPQRKFGVRELANIVKVVPATASTKLEEHRKAGFLTLKKDRTVHLYQANMDHPAYRDLKTYYTITALRKSGLIEYLNKEYILPTIILFGSCATGYDVKGSDMDIVIITEKKQTPSPLTPFEKKMGKKIQLFVIQNLNALQNKHLINNVLSGIVIQGEIRWN